MGCFDYTCFLSNLPISMGDKVLMIETNSGAMNGLPFRIYEVRQLLLRIKDTYSEEAVLEMIKSISSRDDFNSDEEVLASELRKDYKEIQEQRKRERALFVLGTYNDYGYVEEINSNDYDFEYIAMARFDVLKSVGLVDKFLPGFVLSIDESLDIIRYTHAVRKDFVQYTGEQHTDNEELDKIRNNLEISLEVLDKIYRNKNI